MPLVETTCIIVLVYLGLHELGACIHGCGLGTTRQLIEDNNKIVKQINADLEHLTNENMRINNNVNTLLRNVKQGHNKTINMLRTIKEERENNEDSVKKVL